MLRFSLLDPLAVPLSLFVRSARFPMGLPSLFGSFPPQPQLSRGKHLSEEAPPTNSLTLLGDVVLPLRFHSDCTCRFRKDEIGSISCLYSSYFPSLPFRRAFYSRRKVSLLSKQAFKVFPFRRASSFLQPFSIFPGIPALGRYAIAAPDSVFSPLPPHPSALFWQVSSSFLQPPPLPPDFFPTLRLKFAPPFFPFTRASSNPPGRSRISLVAFPPLTSFPFFLPERVDFRERVFQHSLSRSL